jgi:crotonobetainyl-CoA:carnitine CoA-transferase CaiB-like acyl-CoA transferase
VTDCAGLLTGLRVAEIGDGAAGAAAGTVLARLGAQVTVLTDPLTEAPVNRLDRLGRSIDRADKTEVPMGSDEARKAVDRAEIVIQDLTPGCSDPDAHRAVVAEHGASVWTSITPFGLSGPDATRPGSPLVILSASGLLATLQPLEGGPPGRPPRTLAPRVVGAVTGLAALHGLEHRRITGRPVHVDVSSQEALVAMGSLPELAHAIYDCPGKAGSGRYLAPSGTFECPDGLVRITAVENHQWAGLVACLGEPPWATGLEDRQARIDHAEQINAWVGSWTGRRAKAECAELLQGHGVPATPVNEPADLLESPQYTHRHFLRDITIEGRAARTTGVPWTCRLTDGIDKARTAGIAGLRIDELTHVLAGPIVGSLLGAMGADVLRIEDLDRLDIYRRSGPFAGGVAGTERGAYFAVANHSKHSLALPSEEVAPAVADEFTRSQVLIENVGTSRLEKLGVDRGRLADRSHHLVVSVSGFGTVGPASGHRAYASNVHAAGGLAHLTVDDDGRPARLGTVLADPLAALTAATVIAAWALGPEHGRGGVVDLSMAEVVTTTVAELVAAASLGIAPPAAESSTDLVAATADGRHLVIDLSSQAWAEAAVRALGVSTPTTAGPELCRALEARFAQLDARDAVEKLRGAGVPADLVRTAADLLTDDHLRARDFFPSIDHPDPDVADARLVGLPWRFDGEGAVPLAPPPALGDADPAGRDAVTGRTNT